MQKLTNDKWIDCSEKDLVNGDQFRVPVGNGGWHQQEYIPVEKRAVASSKEVVLLFPDESLAELEDLATDKTKPKKDRGKARKVLTILSGSDPLEVSSDTFQGLMLWATILESFSQTDIDFINNTLGV